MDALLQVCRWVGLYYLWRLILADEVDSHLPEPAVARGAQAIITHNVRCFQRAERLFP